MKLFVIVETSADDEAHSDKVEGYLKRGATVVASGQYESVYDKQDFYFTHLVLEEE